MGALADAGRALDARRIQLLVTDRLGRPVRLHSVITCLTEGAARPECTIVRVRTGRYELR
jgi:hypothetical protein